MLECNKLMKHQQTSAKGNCCLSHRATAEAVAAPNSPTATGGLYNISSTKGLTIGFDGHFYPIKGLLSLKFETMRNFLWEGKN